MLWDINMICTRSKLFSVTGLLRFHNRYYRSLGITLSDFATKKKGTTKGPFIELPEFQSLQDSILIKIPSSCTVYGSLKNVVAMSPEYHSEYPPILAQEYDKATGLSKISTGQFPANLIMGPSASISNVAVITIDDYEKGLFVPDFRERVLCYSGDLILDVNNEVKGFGIVAIRGKGPIYQIELTKNEELLVANEAILAYDSNVSLQSTILSSNFNVPELLNRFLQKLSLSRSEGFTLFWNKLFRKDNFISKMRGPGLFLIQTQGAPNFKQYPFEEVHRTE